MIGNVTTGFAPDESVAAPSAERLAPSADKVDAMVTVTSVVPPVIGAACAVAAIPIARPKAPKS